MFILLRLTSRCLQTRSLHYEWRNIHSSPWNFLSPAFKMFVQYFAIQFFFDSFSDYHHKTEKLTPQWVLWLRSKEPLVVMIKAAGQAQLDFWCIHWTPDTMAFHKVLVWESLNFKSCMIKQNKLKASWVCKASCMFLWILGQLKITDFGLFSPKFCEATQRQSGCDLAINILFSLLFRVLGPLQWLQTECM